MACCPAQGFVMSVANKSLRPEEVEKRKQRNDCHKCNWNYSTLHIPYVQTRGRRKAITVKDESWRDATSAQQITYGMVSPYFD